MFGRYVWLYSSIIAFASGYFVSHKIETVKYQKYILQQQTDAINQRNHLLDLANKSAELSNKKEMELQSKLNAQLRQSKIKDKELNDAKNKINDTNYVNALFVRSMGAAESYSMSETASGSGSNVSDNTRIPAFRPAQWSRGLKEAFDNCRLLYNTRIEYDNEQRKLINGK